jgi:MFS family permease
VTEPARLRFADYRSLVASNRNYRLLWLAQLVSELGDWLYSVVIYNLLLETTGSAKVLAGAVVLQVLPQVLASPLAGVINDRLPRRTVMIAADIARFFIVAGMMWAVAAASIPWVYALLLAESVMWGLFEPGRDALLPNLTLEGRERLAANTLSAATWSFNLAAGAALGGILTVAFGPYTVLTINAISFLISAALIVRIRVREDHAAAQGPLRPRDLVDFAPMAEGFRYVLSQSRLLACLLAKTGLGLMGANHVILPVLGQQYFPAAAYGGVAGMSLLMTARGAGALIGPPVAGYFAAGRPERIRRGILFAFLAISAGYGIVAASTSAGLAVAGIMLAHAGGSTIWVFSATMLQSLTGDRFRGRVFSADYAFLILSMSMSAWTGGVAADAGVPIRGVALGVALLVAIPAAGWLWFALPLWREGGN